MASTRRILIVDDDAAIRESLLDALADRTTEVRTADSAAAALQAVDDLPPDLVLTDVRMPGTDGIELLRLLRERAPFVDVVLMTAFDDLPTVASAMREGAREFLVKPLDLHDLRRVVSVVFDDRRLRTSVRSDATPSEGESHELVSHDPRMIAIYKVVGQVAASRASVLIRGESGTGKELIARAIHAHSADAHEPFVAVNCSALSPALLESELFGHVRGAFTGAITARPGRFALAGHGTIFLDEIGDTSVEFQSKLLRVLQEHEFDPVGADHSVRTEARVIAATHRQLEDRVASGHFREDVYYRLRVVDLWVPPLRDRLGDLPALTTHLVHRASRALQRPEPILAPETLDAIRRHTWPGNVRELENCLRRAVVLATGNVIHPEHLGIGPVPAGTPADLPSLADLEREHVARVLAASQGQKGRAAQILGISRPRLNRLLKQYGLE